MHLLWLQSELKAADPLRRPDVDYHGEINAAARCAETRFRKDNFLDGASCPPPPKWTPAKNVTERWFAKRGLKVVEFDCSQACAQFGWLLTFVNCVLGWLKAI